MGLITLQYPVPNIAQVSLTAGRANPISSAVLNELLAVLDALHQSPPQALLLDAQGASVFSGGFALPIIASFERQELQTFLWNFMDCLDRIIRLPCPSVTALNGHAVAAGFILSLATDFRIITRDTIKLGLPEVDLGVPVPAGAQELFSIRTTPQFALYRCTTGELFGPNEAHRIGYADRLVDQVDEEALAFAKYLSAKPSKGASIGRMFRAESIATRIRQEEERYHDRFLNQWFSAAAQTTIQAQAKRLSSGRST